MNIFQDNEYVLIEIVDGNPRVISSRTMTFKEIYDKYKSLWLINPKGLKAIVVRVASRENCSECGQAFGGELVCEIHQEDSSIYGVYCFPCVKEKKIDFEAAECQIIMNPKK